MQGKTRIRSQGPCGVCSQDSSSEVGVTIFQAKTWCKLGTGCERVKLVLSLVAMRAQHRLGWQPTGPLKPGAPVDSRLAVTTPATHCRPGWGTPWQMETEPHACHQLLPEWCISSLYVTSIHPGHRKPSGVHIR